MGSFVGDMLRMLAHTGMQTGGTLLANMISQPMVAERQAQVEKILPTLLNRMGSETDPEMSGEIASRIKDISGIDLRTKLPAINPAGNVEAGANPTDRGYQINSEAGRSLTAPRSMNLADLAPGETTVPGFIRPTPSLESMKTGALTGKSPQVVFDTIFPKDKSLEAAKFNLAATLEAKAREGEANRASREGIARDALGLKEEMAKDRTDAAKDRIANTQQWRTFLMGQMADKTDEMKRKGASAEEMRELTQFSTLQNQLGLATGEQKKTIQTQLNTMLDNTKNPMLQQFPKYTEDVVVPGTGVNLGPLGTWGANKTKVPVGGANKTAPSTSSTPSPIELQGYKTALTVNANNPDIINQIKAKALAKYPKYNWEQ